MDVGEEVKQALKDQRLIFAYQPVVTAHDADVAFYECLLRMKTLDGNLLPAGAFVPAVEQLGLMRTIDRRVLEMSVNILETYPRDDPGPHTLLTSLGPSVNRERLEWVLSRGGGYVGVVTEMGSRFAGSEEALEPVLDALGDRGLLMLDNGSTVNSRIGTMAGRFGLPQVTGNRQIDADADRDAIDLRLQELEDLARENGFAVGLAHPYPLTFERLAAWIPMLERKGIVLAPITAVANRPGTG